MGEKQALVPQLRFPEFRDAGEWQERPLSKFIESLDAGVSVNSGDRPATLNEKGILKTSAVTDGVFDPVENKVVVDAGEVKRLKEQVVKNTIIISRMNTPALVGANAYIEDNCENLFLPDRLWAAKPKPNTCMRFIAYILGAGKGRAALSELATGTSGSMKNIAKANVLDLPMVTPCPEEQQKIADCLSSLDELISAQTEKIDALKTHKIGLMQQLFPREGETVPRLRFPDFRNAGEWIEKPLGALGQVSMCKRIFSDQTNDQGGVPFFKIGTLGRKPDAYIGQELFEEYRSKFNYPRKGEVLITCSGTVGKCLPFDGSDAYFQDSNIVWIDNPKLEISNELLHSILSSINWGRLNSTTITRIYGTDLRDLSLTFPRSPEEQQKIADCLASLDALITACTEKLDALKAHKKGLMQQLFPSVEVAGA